MVCILFYGLMLKVGDNDPAVEFNDLAMFLNVAFQDIVNLILICILVDAAFLFPVFPVVFLPCFVPFPLNIPPMQLHQSVTNWHCCLA